MALSSPSMDGLALSVGEWLLYNSLVVGLSFILSCRFVVQIRLTVLPVLMTFFSDIFDPITRHQSRVKCVARQHPGLLRGVVWCAL